MVDYTPALRRLQAIGVSPNLVCDFSKGRAGRASIGVRLPLRSSTVRFVLEGWLVASRNLPQGQHHFGFYLPGDIIDEFPEGESPWDEILTLTPATVMSVSPEFQRLSACEALLDFDRREKHRTLHAQILRLGCMDAQQRLAHFVLEIDGRRRAATLDAASAFAFPLTQLHMADYLGLSAVHVNRTVKALRTLNLAHVGRKLEITDRPGLERLCGWRASDAQRSPVRINLDYQSLVR